MPKYAQNKSSSSKSQYGYSQNLSGENKSTSSKQQYVYSLNLSDGNKYVGITSNPEKRFNDHFNGTGAQWTQKHQPISINSINDTCSI